MLPWIVGVEDMDASGGDYPVLEVADPQRRESLLRENVPDPLAGEQTWPTAEVRSAVLHSHCMLGTLCLAAQVSDERRQSRVTLSDWLCHGVHKLYGTQSLT